MAIAATLSQRMLPSLVRLDAVFRHDLLRYQGNRKPNAERHDDKVVGVSQQRNKIRK
jgi:hypothetical protein